MCVLPKYPKQCGVQYLLYNLLHKCLCRQTWIHRREISYLKRGGGRERERQREGETEREKERKNEREKERKKERKKEIADNKNPEQTGGQRLTSNL
jgi:hypothetical protein